jgi:spore germination cell wall hydrolase CwlJ-like protein
MKALLAALLLLVSISTADARVQTPSYTERDVRCLATNIYHEARGEGYLGGLAVAVVTLNRTRHVDYPRTVCEVVYQPQQFSWTNRRGHKPTTNPASIYLARVALSHRHPLRGLRATHYHTTAVRPGWRLHLKRVTHIGNHVFYSTKL